MGKSSATVVQNPAGKRFDRSEIIAAVEPIPPDGPTSAEAMTAAVCELADRVQTKSWSETLSKTIFESK